MPKIPGLVFFDIAPMKYTGWAEIAAEVPKALAAYRALKLTSEDLRAYRMAGRSTARPERHLSPLARLWSEHRPTCSNVG